MTGPGLPSGEPPSRSFDAEVRRATAYERGLAVKTLIALAIVAVLIVVRLLTF